MKKVRNAAKTLGKKLKKSKPGKALKNSASKLRNVFKKKRDKLRTKLQNRRARNSGTTTRRTDRRSPSGAPRQSDSSHATVHQEETKNGMPDIAFRAMLSAMRRWYRLSSLTATGSPHRTAGHCESWRGLRRRLSDSDQRTGRTDDYDERQDEVPKPKPKIPNFTDNRLATNFTAEYLNKSVKGTPAPDANPGQPIGWDCARR